jgi:hypothetical protein
MGSRALAIDVWQTTTHVLVDRTVAGILDACELGPVWYRQPIRDPSQGEQARTDRRDGNFHPTPPGTSRRADVSRPTESAVLALERTWQQAAGSLYEICTRWNRHPKPTDPPRRADSRGHTLLGSDDEHGTASDARACLTMVVELGTWLHGRVGELADEWRPVADDYDAHKYHETLSKSFARDLESVRRRWAPDRRSVKACIREGCWRPRWKAGICKRCYEDPRPCQCDTACGRSTVRGEGGTHPTCRQRRARAAKENA